jgi:hypothetical protein
MFLVGVLAVLGFVLTTPDGSNVAKATSGTSSG